ncbi:MAG: cytochrome C oxidase assembly protein [Pseudomonadota bacterium]
MTDEEIKARQERNNICVGACLIGVVVLVFGVTVVKMMSGHNMEAFDHVYRPALEQSN